MLAAVRPPNTEEERFKMTEGAKVVVNLATGLEDPERVTVAFLVAGAAAERGKKVAMFLTKEAVRLAVPGVAEVVACDGCPPLDLLFQQFAENGGELLVCPICVKSRKIPEEFVSNAQLAGATPLWEWIGDEAVSVFSY
jgi:predicted peroxiredoxin